MAMIYRRNPHGGRLTTTIPLNDALRQSQTEADNNDKDDDLASLTASSTSRGRVLSRWLRCRAWRRNGGGVSSPLPLMTTAPTGSSSRALSFRLCQILWQALLVYAFFGLPVLGRILNFCRYFHRFTVSSILTGLVVGFSQDFAIFVQASTIIVLIKALFQPVSLQRRLSAMTASSASAGAGSGSSVIGGSSAVNSLAQERYPHSIGGGPRHVHLPVYFPVRTNDYELHIGANAGAGSSESDQLDPSLSNQPKHLTLVASSSSSATSFPWSLSSSTASMSPAAAFLVKFRMFCTNALVVVLIKIVLVLATIASVADFCLQVTMHPRLNRAFVEIFVNYMDQFTGSLMDEEVLTPPVVFTWATYVVLVVTMTYGFYAERLPFLPDLLSCSSSSGSHSSWCCVSRVKRLSAACTGILRRRSYRKDSALPAATSIDETTEFEAGRKSSSGFIKSLYRSYWRRKESDIIILNETSSGLTSTVSAATRAQHRRRRNSSQGHGLSMLGLHSSGVFGGTSNNSTTWTKPKTPLGIVLHCIVASVFVSLGALCASMIVHTSAGALSRSASKHHALIGVDMQLMANPMFALQTENFFARKSRIGADHINCTAASATLLRTLGKSEVYDTTGLGNGDSCALMWRKTTGYEGETWWDVHWNVTHAEPAATAPTTNASTANASSATAAAKLRRQPNIIVINMESWRHLDVGVLGGAEKLKKYGKSVTPNFDRFSKEGVLYSKHYTQCVQTTRTLLTTLFGMLPSCTETTALKMYGTGLTVRGLPQFLKARGYYNMFWSAVDLTWEYWDKFLLANGFDKLVDDQKIRKMLHEVHSYKDRDDDHFSWGMHDHLSFDMLLHAIEVAKNNSKPHATLIEDLVGNFSATANGTAIDGDASAVETKLDAPKNESTSNAATLQPAQQATTSYSKIRGRDNHDKATNMQNKDPVESHDKLASVGPAEMKASNASRRIRPMVGWEGLREPYFIDMYTITSHNPWALPEDYVVPDLSELYTRFNKRYIDSMYFSDDMLGKFIDDMRAKGLMKNTVVIVEGDHGYGRLEHDNNPSIADSAVYDEATHVPFLILADDFLTDDQRGVQVDQLTMQSDLMATIADLLGVSPEAPLLQHGFGHSMRRKRSPKQSVKDVDFDVIHKRPHNQDKERRVVLCNPFNGLTKGTRTEELKYVFNPDGSYKVFELERDPVEKKPVESGYDYEQMDEITRDMLDFVSEQVDLNQFLFETNKFTTKLPTPVPTSRARAVKETEASQHSVAPDTLKTQQEPEVTGVSPVASPAVSVTAAEVVPPTPPSQEGARVARDVDVLNESAEPATSSTL